MTSQTNGRTPPPALLTMADYYGTLAAVRALGRAGVPVTMAESRTMAPASWSRYVARRVACPSPEDVDAFLAWLLEFGQREPGHVLYPTSDDLAWVYARHRDALSQHFRLLQPGVDVIYGLLNKKRLSEVATRVGLHTPATWFPHSPADLERVAREAPFPVLVKPQTQILFEVHSKGLEVRTPADLAQGYAEFVRRNRYRPQLLAEDPDVVHPMVQTFHAEAMEGIYSVSGFVDRSGAVVASRAAVKVLQRPRRLGVGMCFEHTEVDPGLRERLGALCRAVGYYGCFESEFIRSGGKDLLIDFNPRYYGQMAFEVARGMALPLMVHAAACGDDARLAELVAKAGAWRPVGLPVYCHRFTLEVVLRAQGLSRRLSPEEVRRWRQWLREHEAATTDAVSDAGDWKPGVVDVLNTLYQYARHPRAFLRSMVLNR